MSTPTMLPRVRTGIAGFDHILGGGLPKERVYLVQGDPGAGKTTLAIQFLLEGARNGEPGLYVTLSETEEELRASASSHGWSLDGLNLFELNSVEENLKAEAQYTLFHPAEVELNDTTQKVLDIVEKLKPTRLSSTPSPRCGSWRATRSAIEGRSSRSSSISSAGAARCCSSTTAPPRRVISSSRALSMA